MATVTGPVSSLPGSRHHVEGEQCDHLGCEAPATIRVQGETDSFGAEFYDYCAAHVPKREQLIGTCEWCKTPDVPLRVTRDYDEGMHGPVYEVCVPCINRRNEEAEAELIRSGAYDY